MCVVLDGFELSGCDGFGILKSVVCVLVLFLKVTEPVSGIEIASTVNITTYQKNYNDSIIRNIFLLSCYCFKIYSNHVW